MELQLKNHISSYLTDTFIEAIEKFQDLLQKSHQEIQKIAKGDYASVFIGNPNTLVIKKASFLCSGLNKNTAVELTVLRAISNKFYTFILAISDFPVLEIDQMFCIIVRSSDFEGPYFEPWKKGLGPMTQLFIKQPYLQSQVESDDLQIIRVVIENAEIKKPSKYLGDFKQIKTLGNKYFNNNDYLNALNFYEYGLACCNKHSEYKDRAILYSNSAASLYKLSLYDDCLKYCEIAIKIDKNYYKSYSWKVHSLLQKKHFGQIPNLLVILQSKALPQDFSKINNKYSIYLSNSLGMYNWKAIVQQARKPEIIAGDYFSKFIGIRVEDGQNIYYALQNIKKHSVLIISKALVYDKKGLTNINSIYKKIIKCFQLQKTSFNCSFKDLLISNGGKQALKQGTKLEYKEIENRIKRYLIRPRDISGAAQIETLGIWPELIKFTHSCNPNCSIVHFESLMLISTSANINHGDALTIDFVSDISPLKRKQYLMQKLKICCKCALCEWKSWPDFSNKEEVSKVTDTLTNIKLIKQVFWQLLSSGYIGQQQNFLEKETKLIIKQICWSDVVMAAKLMGQNNNKSSSHILNQILVAGLKTFLKIPNQLALDIIEIIK